MYKGIAGSEGIGIGTVVLIEEHEINIETKRVEETGAEIERYRMPLKSLWQIQMLWLKKWILL